MNDAPARHRIMQPYGDTLHDRGRSVRRGRATGPIPRTVRPPVRQGAGPGPRLHLDVQAEVQSAFADGLVPTAANSPIGVVGVARQRNGQLGKEDNCQVGVFLVGVTPCGSALLDYGLYLPESWCEDTKVCKDRRDKAHIPETAAFQTMPQIAAGLIRQTVALDVVRLDWVTADEEYGRNGEFLDELDRLELPYVAKVLVNMTVWTEDPASCVPPYGGRGRVPTHPSREAAATVAAVVSSLARGAWHPIGVGQGAKGPLGFEFAAVRVWAVRHRKPGPPVWLLVRRRSFEPTPEVKYYVGNGDASTPLEVLAGVGCTRHKVEEFFEDAKSYLGMVQYVTRLWVGRQHHMSLIVMAHLFIAITRLNLGKLGKKPELTLDRTVRLLRRVMEVPGLTLAVALLLVDYSIYYAHI